MYGQSQQQQPTMTTLCVVWELLMHVFVVAVVVEIDVVGSGWRIMFVSRDLGSIVKESKYVDRREVTAQPRNSLGWR